MAPKPMANGVAYSITDSHENRIHRLESETSEMKADVAESLVRIATLDSKIDDSRQSIIDKMDIMIDAMQAHAKDSAARFERISHTMGRYENRLEPIEIATKEKKKRILTLRKVSIPLALASAGALATKFGEQLWDWISK